jgi:hypothetical protein
MLARSAPGTRGLRPLHARAQVARSRWIAPPAFDRLASGPTTTIIRPLTDSDVGGGLVPPLTIYPFILSFQMVDVVEGYRAYEPTCDVRSIVGELLASTPPAYLTGLHTVVLTNAAALTGSRKKAWTWRRGKKTRHLDAAGLYHPATRTDAPWIELFVDRTVGNVPRWAFRVPVVRSVIFGRTLFHELGHHIHASVHPEHRDPEDVAETWGRRLAWHHMRRRHWLLSMLLHPVAKVLERFKAFRA